MSRLFGGLLLGVGILIMTCSGLCSLAFIVIGLTGDQQSPAMIVVPLFFGGLPFAVGFGLFQWGRYLLTRSEEPPED